MKTANRSGIRSYLAAAICATAVPQVTLHAQPYPSRPIEFNVHTSPGGGTDLFARTVTEILIKEKAFPQPIIVSNRPGGNGAIAFNHSPAWKEFAKRNNFEDNWQSSAEWGKSLARQQTEMSEFLAHISAPQKP